MNRREDDVLEMTNEEYQKKLSKCKKFIVKRSDEINNLWILEQICRCIENITKED